MYYIRVNYAMHKNQSVLLKKWVMPTVHSGPNSCQLSKKWTLIQPALYGQPVNTNTFYAPINVRINRFWLYSGYVSLREREIDRVTFSCLTHFFLPVTVSTLCGFRDGIENLSNFPFSPLPSLPCLPSRVLLTRTFSRLPCMEANPWWFLVAITLR